MQNKPQDDDLTYALDLSGRMVYIENIPLDKRGLACGCVCPKCKMPLMAKLGHDVPHRKKPHFAHKPDSDCHGYYMTALHLLAEQILEDKKGVMAPEYKSFSAEYIQFQIVKVEDRVERKDLQPDVAGYTIDGNCINIEIRNTSEVKEKKRAKIKESRITCLEIDVRDQKLEHLEEFLLASADKREWINNPLYDHRILEVQYGDKNRQLEKYSKYSNDKRYVIKKKYECNTPHCIYQYYNGQCIYKEDEFYIDDIVYIVCDTARLKRDIEIKKKNVPEPIPEIKTDEKCQEVAEIKPFGNIIQSSSKIQSIDETIQEVLKEDINYLDIEIHNQPIDMIFNKLYNLGVINLRGGLEGSIEKCQMANSSDSIVVLCKFNDRVSPFYVLSLWIDKDYGKLQYRIINRSREKNKNIAEKKFDETIQSFKSPCVDDKEEDQNDLLKQTNYCPF